jgi:spore coat protein CotH
MKIKLLFLFILSFNLQNVFCQINHWETVVFEDDVWDYMVPTTNISSSWKSTGFNTTGWQTGQGGFGYGDGDDNTILPNGTITVYQRIEFTINDTSVIGLGALTIDYDDSYVAYLNGTEISRDLLNSIVPTYNETANGLHEAVGYQGQYPTQITLSKSFLNQNLNQGLNVLAVEVHNESATSSDMSSRVFLHFGINNATTYYSSPPNWFTPPIIFTESNLPIVIINTLNNASIPDEPKIEATMGIINKDGGQINYTNDPFNEFYGTIGIEIRGSSSASFPKKGWGIETRSPNSSNNNVSIFNWPADNDWVLHAPYSDKSLLRNVITYKIGNDMGRYAPRTKLCEVVLNGEYQGVYVFTEKIKINPGRVNIEHLDSNSVSDQAISGGYIFKIDKTTAGGIIAWSSPFLQSSPSTYYTQYQVHDPSYDEINAQQLSYIQNYVTQFETALNSSNFSDPILGYEPFIDVGSFVDFMLVNELTKNVDGYRISTFYYKQHISEGGKIVAGPLWDFNLAFGNANYCEGQLTNGWEIDFNTVCGGPLGNPFHWTRLVQDPDFTHQLNCRWQELRQTKLHEDTLMNYIDSMANYLQDASSRNFMKWQTLGTYVWPNNFIGNTYLEEVNYLKTWLSARIAWMDANMFGSCTDLSLNDNENNYDCHIYPNPVQNEINIIFNQTIINGKIIITTLLGQEVKTINLTQTKFTQVDISNITNGMYFINIYDLNSLVSQQKIIKN